MLFSELKEWVNKVPDEFLNYIVVNGEFGQLDDNKLYRVGNPVTMLFADKETKEIYILNDVDNENINFDDESGNVGTNQEG